MCGIHGKALLNCARVMYNIHLSCPNASIQATAKNALTQMISHIFERMENDVVCPPGPCAALPSMCPVSSCVSVRTCMSCVVPCVAASLVVVARSATSRSWTPLPT